MERADKFFGGDWWRGEFLRARQEKQTAAAAAQHVVDEYRQKIKEETGYESMAIPVRRRPTARPIFHLTLFYRHPAAGYKFADAAARATRRWREAYRSMELENLVAGPAGEGLFGRDFLVEYSATEAKEQEARLSEEWIDQICENLRSSPNRRIEVAENVGVILGSTLGLAGESHIKKAWDRLAREGYVKARDTRARTLWKVSIERA